MGYLLVSLAIVIVVLIALLISLSKDIMKYKKYENSVDTSDETNRFLINTTTHALIRAVGDKVAAKWLAEEYVWSLRGLLPGTKYELIRKTLGLPPTTSKSDLAILEEKYEKSFEKVDIKSWEYGKSLAERLKD